MKLSLSQPEAAEVLAPRQADVSSTLLLLHHEPCLGYELGEISSRRSLRKSIAESSWCEGGQSKCATESLRYSS